MTSLTVDADQYVVVIAPDEPGARLVRATDLVAWCDAELRRRGPIDNPDWRPEWAQTNLIGEGYRFETLTLEVGPFGQAVPA